MQSRWPIVIVALLALPYTLYLLVDRFGPSNLFAGLTGLTIVVALIALWASVRGMLAGAEEAALDLKESSAEREALLESKRVLLRALKDLENEKQMGKLDEADYLRLSESYRARAKDVLAQLDQDLGPYIERARSLVGAEPLPNPYRRKTTRADKTRPEGADAEPVEADAESEAADESASDAPASVASASPEPDALAAKLASLPEEKRKEAEAFLAKLAADAAAPSQPKEPSDPKEEE